MDEYPPVGAPDSWQSIVQMAEGLGCAVKLRSRQQRRRQRRGTTLRVKGQAAYDVFKLIFAESLAAGINLNRPAISKI